MARSFNGTSDKAVVSAAPVTTYPLTLAGWFNAQSVTVKVWFELCQSAGGEAFWLSTDGSSHAVAQVRHLGTGHNAITTATWALNTWIHVAAVFTSSSLFAVYLNGANKVTANPAVTPTGLNTTALAHDESSAANGFSKITAAELGIWNVALSDNEVAALAAGAHPTGIEPAGLAAYFPLWGLGSPEPDLSGNGNSFTLTGSALANHAPVEPYSRRWWGSAPLIGTGGATAQVWPYLDDELSSFSDLGMGM